MRTVFSANTTAKTIVQRVRLRSTSEPPPIGPWPVPTPNAPDRPVSLPELHQDEEDQHDGYGDLDGGRGSCTCEADLSRLRRKGGGKTLERIASIRLSRATASARSARSTTA